MRKKYIFPMLIMTAVVITFGLNDAKVGFAAPPGLPPPNVNIRIDGYLPAPPGVHIQMESGRPYYVERQRRVYIEEDKSSKHYKNKHYKKEKKHPEDRGKKRGHDK